ncbi:MAG: LacI family DNA-binding transcriptional regulator [Abitibacteriaceae bacterium]|nr:LacI family DNA-binding transcriptional regulator [Abditibacteriaceae bacterium]
MSSIKDVAAASGVSFYTVSDILNRGREHLYRPETRARVLQAAQALNYRPHRAAQSMRSKKTREIGFVASNFSANGTLANYSVYPFLVGMSHRLIKDGYHVSLVELEEVEVQTSNEWPPVLQEHLFDGLVIHYGLSSQTMHLMPQLDLPVVWWDSGLFEPHSCIFRDEAEVGRVVTQRLIELGHQRIAMMVGQQGWESYSAGQWVHYSYAQRYESYVAEMQAQGLKEAIIKGYEVPSVAEQIQQTQATAIIMAGVNTLSLVSEAAHLLGKRIPHDLSVATLDREARVPLHGMIEIGGMLYDRYETGQQAAAMLLEALAQADQPPPSLKLSGQWTMGRTIAEAPTALEKPPQHPTKPRRKATPKTNRS